MQEAATSVVNALQNSKQVLFVMHEYLPLPLALWVPSLVSLLSKQGKDVTVLVSEEVFGWPKRVDEVYPTDMVLSLEQLRQVISVPITNNGQSVGEVSYNVTEGNLAITVVPVKDTLDMSQLKTITQGKTYDTVIGVGISASHPLLAVLQSNQASLSSAKAFFIGTYALQGALSAQLSFIPSVTVLESGEDTFLREVLQQITGEKALEPSQRELVTLFVQSIVASTQQFDYLDREGYEYLGKIADDTMDSGRMASIYSGDFATQNRILQQILQSAQKSTNGELILFTVTAKQIEQLKTSVQDVVTALYYLPKYPQVQQVVVVIEEHVSKHHVYMNGLPDAVKQVAIKYGFPKTERLTGGVVEEIHFEKLCQDITRVAGKEELIPQAAVVQYEVIEETAPVTPVQIPVEQKPATRIFVPEVAVSPTIPVVPSLDDVLANTVMPHDDYAESDSGEAYEAIIEPATEQQAVSVPEPVQVLEAQEPYVPVTQVKTSTGLDFAAIAKKMRESIS